MLNNLVYIFWVEGVFHMNKIMSKKVLMLSIVLAVMILGLNVNQSNVHVAANTDTISQHLSTLNNQHETAESETVVSY